MFSRHDLTILPMEEEEKEPENFLIKEIYLN